jgi:acid phosphatase (class A)
MLRFAKLRRYAMQTMNFMGGFRMNRFKLLPVLLAFTLAACGVEQPTSKFPYPPQFVQAEDVSLYTLPAPPQPGSKEYKREIKGIIAQQKTLTADDIATIEKEAHIEPQMLVEPVLGEQFTPEAFPAMYTLLKHAASDAWRINDTIQDHWKETRPWLADQRVARHVEYIDRPGYPSGHTVTNTVWALILGHMMPCQEKALLNRAEEIGYHRVEGGAHFPHDIEAGKKLARVIYHRMLENNDFHVERDEAERELEQAVKFGIPTAEGETVDTGYIARCGAAVPSEMTPVPTIH